MSRISRLGGISFVVLAASCGGAPFSSTVGDGGIPPIDGASAPIDDASVPIAEAGSMAADGGGDAAPFSAGLSCGPTKTCSGATPVCCPGSAFTCAHLDCGCGTTLECASNADCAGTTPICCIYKDQTAGCPNERFVAQCATACVNGSQLCSPSAGSTCLNGQCSTDPGDLSSVGLPSGSGYGVCN